MKKYRWSAILMIVAILGITGFQLYWLKNNYDREKENLEITTRASFRQTILRLQSSKLELEKLTSLQTDTVNKENLTVTGQRTGTRAFARNSRGKEPVITMMNLIQERIKDSLSANPQFRQVPGMRLRRAGETSVSVDTAGFKGDIHSITLSTIIDTQMIDPENIKSVRIVKGEHPGDGVIAISVDRKNTKGRQSDSTSVARVRQDRFPRPGPNRIFMTKDGQDFPVDKQMFRFLFNIDSAAAHDSVTIKEVTAAYAGRLKEDNIDIGFQVQRLDSSQAGLPNAVTIGFSNPAIFGLTLQNSFGYMFDKLKLPALFSLLLVGITIFSFVLLYRNMIKQRRLGELKNEFISNITHELKTPIATVGVAIEALKNFNAIDDAARTREYLDISQNELQRLNLLVDKVLKLSVFEKMEIELKKELFDCRQLVEEVMNSMKLQFEKCRAQLSLQTEGDNFTIEADKLHITSVIYNLLDNALKYSKENPVITVTLKAKEQHIELSVADNGIGIPAEYKQKVFDKFFRVPTGNTHNAKGYGLGLSYVSEVIKRHHGFITVESEFGKGSIFTAYIPYKELSVIQIDEHRKIIKRSIKIR